MKLKINFLHSASDKSSIIMSLLDANLLKKKDNFRFSLLLLEPGEIYFDDYSVFCFVSKNINNKFNSFEDVLKSKQKGRLKICSKSIVFESVDNSLPLIKLVYKDLIEINKFSKTSLLLSSGSQSEAILIKTSGYTEIFQHSIVSPFKYIKSDCTYLFEFNYAAAEDCLAQIQQLHRASTLSLSEEKSMVNAIVLSWESRIKFDPCWFENLYEKTEVECLADCIKPLIINPGRVLLTSSNLYFQFFNNVEQRAFLKIPLHRVTSIFKRRFLLQNVGLEIFWKDFDCWFGSNLYLKFHSYIDREKFYDQASSKSDVNKKVSESYCQQMTLQWQSRQISNLEYLHFLNSYADRSCNDLTQYPVFPWILDDYTSDKLDLSNESIYRNLSKPIGCLNNQRLTQLLKRYEEMPEPKFIYGSHYSTPGFVLFYLARSVPEFILCLHGGKFDHPDRMFNSISSTWENCLSSFADFKELIPEFYDSDGSFLLNKKNINFGVRQDGVPVGDVALPAWASDAKDFVLKMREALESDYVSKNLHHWIDLIFGYKQTGPESEKAHNVFYYLTYEGAVDIDSIESLNEKEALKSQIMEFGQIPKQLFKLPHPKRFHSNNDSHSSLTHQSNIEHVQQETDLLQLNEKTVQPVSDSENPVEINLIFQSEQIHKDTITKVKWNSDATSAFSISKDTVLKLFSFAKKCQLRSMSFSSTPLSACAIWGKIIVVGSWDNNIYFYNFEFGKIVDTVYAHDDAVSDLIVANNFLLSASWDSTIKIWKLLDIGKTDQEETQLSQLDHDCSVACMCTSTCYSQLASATNDGQLFIWSMHDFTLEFQQKVANTIVNSIAFSPDKKLILVAVQDLSLHIINIETGDKILVKQLEYAINCSIWINRIAILLGNNDGSLLIWDVYNEKIVSEKQIHKGAVTCLDFTQKNCVVTGGEDGSLCIIKLG